MPTINIIPIKRSYNAKKTHRDRIRNRLILVLDLAPFDTLIWPHLDNQNDVPSLSQTPWLERGYG